MGFCFRTTILSFVLGILALVLPMNVSAQDCDTISCNKDDVNKYLGCIAEKMTCFQNKVSEAQASAVTLKSAINILNGQINVLQLQIDQSLSEISSLEKEILGLSDRIDGLSYSLDSLTSVLVERVAEHYKRHYVNPVELIFSQKNFVTKLSELKYLRLARQQTSDAMLKAETQRLDYDQQKKLKEEKQQVLESKRKKLESQKSELAQKKSAEQRLLDETKNNEANFQKKLADAKSEYEAQQDIIAGKGQETEVGHVESGEKIASIIPAASCNSSGAHLHFTVSKSGISQNPFSYLKSGVDHLNLTDSCSGVSQDSFNPTGSWEWPLKGQILFNQSFGLTSSLRCNAWVTRLYPSHNGLDIVSRSSMDVYSVKPGKLYRGSYYINSNNCNLRYVRVEHDEDSSLSTFYLHVNY